MNTREWTAFVDGIAFGALAIAVVWLGTVFAMGGGQ